MDAKKTKWLADDQFPYPDSHLYPDSLGYGEVFTTSIKKYPLEIVEDLAKHNFLSSTTSLWQVLYNSRLPIDIGRISDNSKTFCLHSRDDDAAPYEAVSGLAKDYQSWQLITIDQVNHHPWLWANQLCIDTVTKMIDETIKSGGHILEYRNNYQNIND
jgi:hypothetical protein